MLDFLLDWIEGQAAAFWAAVDGVIPDVPPAVADACASLAGVGAWLAPVLWLVPWPAMAAALGIVLLGLATGFAITLVRIGLSLATLGGGGT